MNPQASSYKRLQQNSSSLQKLSGTYIIPGRVPNHDSFLREYAPLLADVQQGPRVGLVGLELAAERRPEGSQAEVVVVKIFHAGVDIASHKTPAVALGSC